MFAYTETDLLNAQNNFQASRNNVNIYNDKYLNAQNAVILAKSSVFMAESGVKNAQMQLQQTQKILHQKMNELSKSKTNLDFSKKTVTQSGLIVDNIWKQVNGGSQ